ARLTPAGERFVRHATYLVQGWERARQHVALPPGLQDGIRVGAEPGLWQPLLADWLIWMRQACPLVALRAEVQAPAPLLEQVRDGSLDLALLYNPPQREGLVLELLRSEELVMVSTHPQGGMGAEQYIMVDWGPGFQASHEAAYPDRPAAAVSISLGPLALDYILRTGGTGYLPASSIAPHLESGALHAVPGAPRFSHAAYAVYAAQSETDTLAQARAGLREIAK